MPTQRSERTCPGCGGQIHDGTLCQGCLDKLARDLDAITDNIAELHTQLARQARVGDNGGGARSAERPLPFDLPASEALDLLRSVLVGWTRDIWTTGPQPRQPRQNGPYSLESIGLAPEANPPTTMREMARYLRWHDWRNHPAADEFADELHWAIDQVGICIDTPPERRYLGPCGAIIRTANGEGHECPGDVMLVGNHMPKCRQCGATYFRDERLQWIADMAEDQLVTATVAAGALSAWGQHITADLVRKWASRGRLLDRGHDRAGRPVYSFGECRVLALETLHRRATRGDSVGA